MPLGRYREKRVFSRTPEPAGGTRRKKGALSYVVQEHHARRLHYDFRLELGGVLLSWAVPKGPSLDPGEKRLAVRVEDHPLEYGTFEGNIPAGNYGAGEVLLWDRGTWAPEGDAKAGLRKGHLRFTLRGEKLKGRWDLVRMAARAGENGKENWLLLKVKDEFARPPARGDVLVQPPESARKRKRASGLPEFVEPELATLVDRPPAGGGWLHEIKLDGYRLLARVDGPEIRLFTRRGLDWTSKFPAIAAALKRLGVKIAMLDGEVVVYTGEGATSFSALQNAIKAGGRMTFVAFDLLALDGEDLRERPLAERKKRLKALLAKHPAAIQFSDHVAGDGKRFFDLACRHRLEGVVSKRADSPYRSGRGGDWQKSKCTQRQEFVLGGFTEGQGSRVGFGALLLGTFRDGNLVYAGKVGTGFDAATLASLRKKFESIEVSREPFTPPVPRGDAKGARWVEPKLVGEVEFTEWTPDGFLRHPSFRGLREDKPAREVVREAANGNVVLSHPEKPLWDGVTKRDLLEFYASIADRILPHVVNRPLALVRCPEGQGRKCFFQKHANATTPAAIRRVDLKGEEGLFIENLDGLLTLVQLGVLEIHPWGSRVNDIEHPDRLIMDLDPAPGVAWPRVVLAARRVRKALQAAGLKSFVKTTGGKGLHVVSPLDGSAGWDEVKAFTKTVAEAMVEEFPRDYVSRVPKSLRRGKILVDWLRNGRGATAVAAFSTRNRPGATVSVPIGWEELGAEARPDVWTVQNLSRRLSNLRREPWKGFFDLRQSLPRL